MDYKKTSLEHLSDDKLLKMLERLDGNDSPIFLECLRRLMIHKINADFNEEIEDSLRNDST